MNFFLLFLLSSLSAWGMAVSLPKIIVRVEKKVIAQCEDIKKSIETGTPIHSLAALALLNIAPVFYFFNPDRFYLSMFIFLLSVSSYIDIVRRWVPDGVIFLCIGVSVYCAASGCLEVLPEEAMMSALLFVIPFGVINWVRWIKSGTLAFASGDIYIALSVGFWLDKTFAMAAAGVSILLALLCGSVFRQHHLPFIPFLLFSFLINSFI